jgi:hypothetical protein
MATYNRINGFVEDLAEKVHNLGSDTLTVALTTVANVPTAATTATLASITQIAYTNLSARAITTSTSAQTSGTYKLVLADLTLTASGTVAAFGEVVLYNDTSTNDNMIAWWEYSGSNITMLNTETFLIDFDGTNGVLQIA